MNIYIETLFELPLKQNSNIKVNNLLHNYIIKNKSILINKLPIERQKLLYCIAVKYNSNNFQYIPIEFRKHITCILDFNECLRIVKHNGWNIEYINNINFSNEELDIIYTTAAFQIASIL